MVLNVKIITPYRVAWANTANTIILPTTTGEIGILSNHANLVTNIETGVLTVQPENKPGTLVPLIVLGGFASVSNNEVIVLLNEVEPKPDMTLEEAETSLAEVISKNLSTKKDKKEQIAFSQKIKQIAARIKILKLLESNNTYLLTEKDS